MIILLIIYLYNYLFYLFIYSFICLFQLQLEENNHEGLHIDVISPQLNIKWSYFAGLSNESDSIDVHLEPAKDQRLQNMEIDPPKKKKIKKIKKRIEIELVNLFVDAYCNT